MTRVSDESKITGGVSGWYDPDRVQPSTGLLGSHWDRCRVVIETPPSPREIK